MSFESDIRRLRETRYTALDGREDDVLASIGGLLKHPGGALALAGLAIENPDVVLQRMISFTLRDCPMSEAWPAWTVFLLPPYENDSTILLNVMTGLEAVSDVAVAPEQVAHSLVPGFLAHALTRPAVVAERAVSAALAYPPELWRASASELREPLLGALEKVIGSVDERELQDFWSTDLVEQRDALLGPAAKPAVQEARRALGDLLDTAYGKSSRELAGVAAEIVEAYLATGASGFIRPVQRLELRARHAFSADIWQVVRAWSELFRLIAERFFAVEEVPFQLSNATTGSLVLDHLFELDGARVDIDGLSARIDVALSSAADDAELECLLRFLQSLADEPATLTLRHYWGRDVTAPIERSPSALRKLREATSGRRVLKVPSVDVPQADRLEKIVRLVEIIHSGEEVLPESIKVGQRRQVDYYKRAAKILGLLDEDGVVTPAGRQLLRVDEPHRSQFLAVLFESSRCGSAWIEWSGGKTLLNVDPESAEAFIDARSIGVTGSTIGRRVQSLKSWWAALAPHHYAAQGPDERQA